MNRLLLLPPLALLVACHSDTKTPATATRPDTATTPPKPAAPQDSPGASYRIYRGLLPGTTDSLTLHLVQSAASNGDFELNGTYASYADASGQPFQLVRRESAADSLLLEDISYEHSDANHVGPLWKLKQQGSTLVGTVSGQHLRLQQVQPPGSIPMVVRYYVDSIVAFPDLAKSPVAHLSLQALLPKVDNPVLTDNILRDLRGDTVSALPVISLPQLWAQQQAAYQKTYREDAAENRKGFQGATDELSALYGLNYVQLQTTYVFWNQAPLLSLGVLSYDYTGGAHGSYGTAVATYSTRTGQRLRFTDIFRPGAETKLQPILTRAVRRAMHTPVGQPLDRTLFDNNIPVTHNVCLTSGGVLFVYVPYEIASYAHGEIHIFVPMKELQSVMLPPTPSS